MNRELEDRQTNFNAQTWIDVRMFADICLFYQQEGLELRTATILRDCVERVHSAIIGKLPEGAAFVSIAEAIEFIKSIGISVAQLEKDNRSRKKIGDALVLEDRYMDSGKSLEAIRKKIEVERILSKAGISRKFIEEAADLVDRNMLKEEGRIDKREGDEDERA